ncbi:MAG: hypothetical protein ABIF19_14540 [Planctomycetota bacterium]
MARIRGKKALYEVMSQVRAKSGQDGSVEPAHPARPVEDEPPVRQEKSTVEVPKAVSQWWKKPRVVQFNAGRFEFSMPYQLAVALLLGFILVVLAAYRLGQFSYVPERQEAAVVDEQTQAAEDKGSTDRAMTDIIPRPAPVRDEPRPVEVLRRESPGPQAAKETKPEPVNPTGTNVIVLVQFDRLADLSPVQAHFAEHGIDTVIVPEGGRYFLQTKNRYDNPDKPGTDGYKVKQRIIEVGKTYKAPPGNEPFATHLFSDAYGKKVK